MQRLSKREAEVESLLLAGRSIKEVAAELNISHSTAMRHTEHLYRKRSVSSRIELARAAVRRGEHHRLGGQIT